MIPRGDVLARYRSAAEDMDRRRVMLAVTLLLVLVVLIGGVQLIGPTTLVEPAWVRRFIERAGPFAPIAFVGLQALQVIVAPIPGQLLAGVGGYLFGVLVGAAYSLLGVVIGSYIVFFAARQYGRPVIARLLSADTYERFERFGAANGSLALFVFFLLPVFPDDALCVVAGVWEIRPRTFGVLLIVGRAPSFLAAAYAGTSVYQGAFERLGILMGAIALLAMVVHVGHRRIEAALRHGGESSDS